MCVNAKLKKLKLTSPSVKEIGYVSTLVAMLLLAGCATGERAGTQTSMRGAATEYCESMGGQSEVQETRLGSDRYCRLPDGRVENEWQFYRSEQLDND